MEVLAVQHERDLYRHLLELGAQEALEPFVAEALALIAVASRAQRGYFEIFDEREGPGEQSFWVVHGCSPDLVSTFRAGISEGVIAEALTSRRTVLSASALQDPRFRGRGSVQRHHIEAVLCVPIAVGNHIGVIYLQGRSEPGPFSEEDRQRAEVFARHIAPLTDRLLLRRTLRAPDPTEPFRRRLRADAMIGASEACARALRDASLAAPLDVSVLIVGPTGTGKSMLARIVHHSGPRCERPFIELNCAALPDTLVESELFGALPGAHSTAGRKVEGKVAAAAGGTLFLDEIGDLSLQAQAKILQLLQNKEYYPLGSARPLQADVRIITATHQDLRAAVALKTFREDLLYRLEVLTIRMPALREREDDIPALVGDACRVACARHGFPALRPSPAAMHAAQTAEWPGNVRQLYHAVETAVIHAHGEGVLLVEPRHLFPDRRATASDEALSYQEATRRFQRVLVQRTLDDVDWNVSDAARRLDLGRTYLYKLISSLGVARRG